MLEFSTASHRIILSPKSLMAISVVAELREIYEGDESPAKKVAVDILTYVHIVSQIDIDAPFFSARQDEVQKLTAANIWGKDWSSTLAFTAKEDLSNFTPAIEAYTDAFEKPEVRVIRSYNRKIDQLQDMIDDVEPTIEKSTNANSGTFTYVTNTNPLMKVMKEMRAIINERKAMEEMLKQGADSERKTWGGKAESYHERKKREDTERRSRRLNEKDKQQIQKEKPAAGVSQAGNQAPENF